MVVRKVKKRRKLKVLKPLMMFLLAAAAVVGMGYMAKKSFNKQVQIMSKEDKKTFGDLSKDLEEYRETFERYPESFDELLDLEWIEKKPVDMHSRPLHYSAGQNGKSYDLRSAGKDGRFLTSDDICLKTVSKNNIPFRFYTCQNQGNP